MPQMTEMLSAVLSRFGLLQTKQDTPSLAVATQQAYPPPTDTLPVLPPGELLAHRCAAVNRIEELAGTTPAHFEQYYLDTLHRFACWSQQRPASPNHYAHPGGLLDLAMETAAAALKIRQGHLLPPGAPPEEAVLKKDLWTFSVFTLALLGEAIKPTSEQTVTLFGETGSRIWNPWSSTISDDPAVRWYRVEFNRENDLNIPESASLMLANLIIAPVGLAWLSSDPHAFSAWLAYLSGDKATAGALGHIIDKARKLPESVSSKASESNKHSEPKPNPLPETGNVPIQSIHENALESFDSPDGKESLLDQKFPSLETTRPESSEIAELAELETSDIGKDKEAPAAKFMEWLRTGIEQGRIPYNEKNARVHVVPDGVLLVTPNIFKDFTDEWGGGRWDTVQKLFIKRKDHVRTASGENIHHYMVGTGSSQTVLSGFLLKDTALVFGEFVPESNQLIRNAGVCIDNGRSFNGSS